MSDSASPYIVAATLLAMACVAVAGYLLLPKADVLVPLVEGCRLDQQACASDLPGGGRIEVAIEPRPVPTAQPFRLRITLDGMQAEKVEAEFTGVGMNMGATRLRLEAADGGRYTGQVSLPACVTGGMTWQATVFLDDGRRVISVPFRFESGHA